MKKGLFLAILVVLSFQINAQISSTYEVSFENAVHHETEIKAIFTNLKNKEVEFRMSRTSPGRYALHEFVKNVYNVKVTDGNGKVLNATRPDPYSWKVSGHNGTIKVSYTLFANHGDGTYSQVDETHAHLNMPATFMYVPELKDKEMQVTFNVREDLNWKVATQLKHVKDNTFYAKDLQYFMDSPTEISNYGLRTFDVDGQSVHLVLHHNGTDAELDQYFESVKKVVLEQKAVFGELPKFDYGNYYFLACYIPNVSGDGMEHRNSTVIPSTRSLANGGMERNIGTVSHEFFHAWNVERIRPKSLEPFDFEAADMSGELWFAEGFTSYYTGLILCRAGLNTQEDYIKGLAGTFNYVWNSPGRNFFNPIEMSYQAPFVDAARSVDEVNRGNTFISYYSYGSALGLALDLALREKGLNLDDYMKLVWTTFGKTENPYTIEGLQKALIKYAGADFGNDFFNKYIYKSEMPDMKPLFESVGVSLTKDADKVWFGSFVRDGKISGYPTIGSPAYKAGLDNEDTIKSVGDFVLSDSLSFNDALKNFKPNDKTKIVFERFGEEKETEVTFMPDPSYSISVFEANGLVPTEAQKANRDVWLSSKN
ncbi:MAG: peptidase M61 [Flavobacteriaceae bacterium]|nr:M61 family metallopeptidase [Flavobacteriaceae bacterium]